LTGGADRGPLERHGFHDGAADMGGKLGDDFLRAGETAEVELLRHRGPAGLALHPLVRHSFQPDATAELVFPGGGKDSAEGSDGAKDGDP